MDEEIRVLDEVEETEDNELVECEEESDGSGLIVGAAIGFAAALVGGVVYRKAIKPVAGKIKSKWDERKRTKKGVVEAEIVDEEDEEESDKKSSRK